jgi:hypothetical protein
MILSAPFSDLPIVGDLEVLDVFAYHDGPRLFTAKNAVGGLFLVEWAAQGDAGEIWLIAPLSLARYKALASGHITFRTVFTDSELGFVYQVHVQDAPAEASVVPLPSSAVPEGLLPIEGERVDDDEARVLSTTAHLVGLDQSILTVPSLDLRIEPSNFGSSIIAIRDFADLLVRLQRLYDAVFISLAGQGKRKRPKLGIVQAYTGSLGMVLRSVGNGAPTDASTASASLTQMANLIDAAMNLKSDPHAPRASWQKVSDVLDWFAGSQTDATLGVVAIPEWRGFSTRITPDRSREAIDFLHRQGLPALHDGPQRLALSASNPISDTTGAAPVKGEFRSLDIVSRKYEFQGENRMVFGGFIADSAMEAARHVTFGLSYSVRVVRDVSPNAPPMTWLLLEIIPNSRQLA